MNLMEQVQCLCNTCFVSRTNAAGAGPFSQQVTIETLPDDILLNIFRHHLHASPQLWHKLTHVCQRWRQNVLTLPLGLHLRLYCTRGTPVLKTLECWPPFPLVLNYGRSSIHYPPAPEDEENIMAALKQSDRVRSITLTLTNSLLENLSTISEPLSELEELVLLSRDSLELTFPSAFRSGSRLRTLYLTRISTSAFPQLISRSTGLVDLRLHEISNVGYFPPDVFVNAVSAMTQLETLSLHFLSLPPRRSYVGSPPPPEERVVLPALKCLKYRGTSKYLDKIVARIDAPRLGDMDITFFSQPTMDALQLGQFIERIEMETSLVKADVQTSAHAISITFPNPSAMQTSLDQADIQPPTTGPISTITFPNSSAPPLLRLQISCKWLDWQLSSMTQICNHFSPFLFRVEDLRISSAQSPREEDGMTGEQWPELIRAFSNAKVFRVAGVHVKDILYALRSANGGDTAVLPVLRDLRVQKRMPTNGSLWNVAQSFITSRLLSGHQIELLAAENPRGQTVNKVFECTMCGQRFKRYIAPSQHIRTHTGERPPQCAVTRSKTSFWR